MKILPCSKCSQSAQEFERNLKLIRFIVYQWTNRRGSKKTVILRSRIAQFFYQLHNLVNAKLGKPSFGVSWRDALKRRNDWIDRLFNFCLCVGWNFTPERKLEYEYFFCQLLPAVLKHTSLHVIFIQYQENKPIPLDSKEELTRWIYDICRIASRDQHIYCTVPWKFDDVCDFLEAIRARKGCDEESEKMQLGCQ